MGAIDFAGIVICLFVLIHVPRIRERQKHKAFIRFYQGFDISGKRRSV